MRYDQKLLRDVDEGDDFDPSEFGGHQSSQRLDRHGPGRGGYGHRRWRRAKQYLERFLLSRAGRPWGDVFAELVRNREIDLAALKCRNGYHEVAQICVAFHIVFDDEGRPHEKGASGPGVWDPFWVNPETGILERTDYERHGPSCYAPRRPMRQLEEKKIGPEQELHKINGIWYWAVFADVPKEWEGIWYHPGETAPRKPGDPRRYRKSYRQACSEDLRRHGVENDQVD